LLSQTNPASQTHANFAAFEVGEQGDFPAINYMEPIEGSELSNLGAYLAAPEPMTDTYGSSTASRLGGPAPDDAPLLPGGTGVDYGPEIGVGSHALRTAGMTLSVPINGAFNIVEGLWDFAAAIVRPSERLPYETNYEYLDIDGSEAYPAPGSGLTVDKLGMALSASIEQSNEKIRVAEANGNDFLVGWELGNHPLIQATGAGEFAALSVLSKLGKLAPNNSIFNNNTRAEDVFHLDNAAPYNFKVFDNFSPEARFSLGNASSNDLAKISKLAESNPDVELLLRSAFFSQRKAAQSKVLDPNLADFQPVDNPLGFVENSLKNIRIAEARGYPYGFSSRDQFVQFREKVANQVEQLGLPKDSIILQGSNLFKNNPGDIDVGIRLSAEQFDDYVRNQSLIAGKQNKLSSLERALRNGKLDDTNLYGPKSARRAFRNELVNLSNTRSGKVDFSLIKEGSTFDQIINRNIFSF
jgi:hypothetical protein